MNRQTVRYSGDRKHSRYELHSGFTLIELLVVVAVLAAGERPEIYPGSQEYEELTHRLSYLPGRSGWESTSTCKDNTMQYDVRDRVRGILFGLAAGDRNGGPIRMALLLAQSLAEQQRFDGEDLFQRYLHWWQTGGFDTGPVAERVFELVTSGIHGWAAVCRTHTEARGRTAGCNPAHRSAPLAMAAFLPDAHLSELAGREALLTHRDPLAGDVAAATVELCRALVRGTEWKTALSPAVIGRQPATLATLQDSLQTPLSRGGYAPETLQAALCFVSRHTEAATALQESIAFAGPANYCPVLVGAIAGARWGTEGLLPLIPPELQAEVQNAAEALADSWSQDPDL